jgi:hypothetical protein
MLSDLRLGSGFPVAAVLPTDQAQDEDAERLL